MLRIQVKITVLPAHLAGVDVVVLIPHERILMNGKGELNPKNGAQNHNAEDRPFAAAWDG
jgi:hypothetical protein